MRRMGQLDLLIWSRGRRSGTGLVSLLNYYRVMRLSRELAVRLFTVPFLIGGPERLIRWAIAVVLLEQRLQLVR